MWRFERSGTVISIAESISIKSDLLDAYVLFIKFLLISVYTMDHYIRFEKCVVQEVVESVSATYKYGGLNSPQLKINEKNMYNTSSFTHYARTRRILQSLKNGLTTKYPIMPVKRIR